MRILHLDTARNLRGGQWQALRLVQGLAQAGIESSLLAAPASALFAKARELGLDVRPAGVLSVATLARRADLVHAHDARAHTLAALVSAAPVVVSRRVAFPIRSRWKYRRAAHYLAVSEYVKRVLEAGGVAASRITVVYDGVPLRPEARGQRILAPATSDPRKGTALALKAARHAGVTLHLSSDLENDLADAAMLVYITHSEGLGSAALLAMSAGVPVIASQTGGLPEIIRHGENGILTENTPEAIAAAMRSLLEDPALAARLAAAARRTVEEKFSSDHMVRATIDVYRKVLTES